MKLPRKRPSMYMFIKMKLRQYMFLCIVNDRLGIKSLATSYQPVPLVSSLVYLFTYPRCNNSLQHISDHPRYINMYLPQLHIASDKT